MGAGGGEYDRDGQGDRPRWCRAWLRPAPRPRPAGSRPKLPLESRRCLLERVALRADNRDIQRGKLMRLAPPDPGPELLAGDSRSGGLGVVIAAGIEANLITRIENARRGLLDLSA